MMWGGHCRWILGLERIITQFHKSLPFSLFCLELLELFFTADPWLFILFFPFPKEDPNKLSRLAAATHTNGIPLTYSNILTSRQSIQSLFQVHLWHHGTAQRDRSLPSHGCNICYHERRKQPIKHWAGRWIRLWNRLDDRTSVETYAMTLGVILQIPLISAFDSFWLAENERAPGSGYFHCYVFRLQKPSFHD